MEKIKPSIETSQKEIEERVYFIENTASEILKFSKEHEDKMNVAIQMIRELKKFVDEEYHELTLVKNAESLENNEMLRKYTSIFGHMHFMSGRITKENFSWNLDEFHQGTRTYNLFN